MSIAQSLLCGIVSALIFQNNSVHHQDQHRRRGIELS